MILVIPICSMLSIVFYKFVENPITRFITNVVITKKPIKNNTFTPARLPYCKYYWRNTIAST
jgi:hypothetical protein